MAFYNYVYYYCYYYFEFVFNEPIFWSYRRLGKVVRLDAHVILKC